MTCGIFAFYSFSVASDVVLLRSILKVFCFFVGSGVLPRLSRIRFNTH